MSEWEDLLSSRAFKSSVVSVVIGLVVDWTINAGRATADVISLIGDQIQGALRDAGFALVNPFEDLGGGFLDWLAITATEATDFAASFGPFAPLIAVLAVGVGVWVLIVLLKILLEGVKWVT